MGIGKEVAETAKLLCLQMQIEFFIWLAFQTGSGPLGVSEEGQACSSEGRHKLWLLSCPLSSFLGHGAVWLCQ